MKIIHKIKFCLNVGLLVLLLTCHTSYAQKTNLTDAQYTTLDLADIFNGLRGTAVFYTPQVERLEIFHKELALIQQPPQSTFKIISTLMGLSNGIIKDETSTMHYNGSQYWLDAWNKDVTLTEAFQYSCVWYYNQVVYAITQDKVNNFLEMLNYGNTDTSQWKGNGSDEKDELNGFWLSSSLKISPLEQVEVLSNIFEGKTSIEKKHIDVLKKIMHHEIAGQKIYAKTGSNLKGKSWFVGFTMTTHGEKYFAFYVDDPNGGISSAKEIATQFFTNPLQLGL